MKRTRSSTVKHFVLSSLLFATAACGPAAPFQDRALQERRAKAGENDPAVTTWLADVEKCEAIDWHADEYYPDFEKYTRALKSCLDKADDDLVATWTHDAEVQQEPAAKAASLEASRCVRAAPLFLITFSITMSVKARDLDGVRKCGAERTEALARAVTAKVDEITKLTAEQSLDSWFAFVEKHPGDPRLPQAAKQIAILANGQGADAQATTDERLLALYPPAIDELPIERRILLFGPKGSRVRDLKKMQDAKIAKTLILSRIKASSAPYKTFEGDEMIALKELGFSDDVVTAMIEVTTKLETRKRADDEREAIRAQLAELKQMIEEKKAASADGKTSGQVVQTKDGPLDVLASCAKRLGAVKLCEQMPFPASTVCTSTAESSFPCNKT